MAAQWANSDLDVTSYACAWADSDIPVGDVTDGAHASAWASSDLGDASNVARAWAQSSGIGDDANLDAAPEPAAAPLATINKQTVSDSIESLTETTMATYGAIINSLDTLLDKCTDLNGVGEVALLMDNALSKLTTLQNKDALANKYVKYKEPTSFVEQQLKTPDANIAAITIVSRTAETREHKLSAKVMYSTRALMSTGIIAVQRASAEILINNLCDRVEALGGISETYFEKHRGDETPFTRAAATDSIGIDETIQGLDDERPDKDAPQPDAVANLPQQTKQLLCPLTLKLFPLG